MCPGRSLDEPDAAGLAARALALGMARTHLSAGHDVLVAQFLARPDFIEELERVAVDCAARFVEIALILERHEAIAAFGRRSAAPENQSHRDAAALVARSGSSDAVGETYDAFLELLNARPAARSVGAKRNDVEGTLQLVDAEIRSS